MYDKCKDWSGCKAVSILKQVSLKRPHVKNTGSAAVCEKLKSLQTIYKRLLAIPKYTSNKIITPTHAGYCFGIIGIIKISLS